MPQPGPLETAPIDVIDNSRLPRVQPPFGHHALGGASAWLCRCAQAQGDSWLGRRLALGLRRLVLGGGIDTIDAEWSGLRFRWYPQDNVTDRHALFLPRSWDVPERHFQEQHLPADGVYLDIGANSGLYSVLALSRLDQRGTLIALEPNPVMFRRLLVNIALNDPVARLRLHCCGVAERAGNFTLQLSSRNLGAARLGGDGQGAGRVRVVCRPLIDILRQDGVERVDVMKIDIEGYESRALNPFFASAPRSLWPRFINIESPQGVDWKALGYVVVQTTRQNTLLSLA